MPEFSGKFEWLVPGQGAVQEGPARVSFDQETFTLVGAKAPIAFDLGDVDVFEPGEYDLRLVLYSGQALRLKQFGKTFQDLQHHLREAYRNRLVQCLLVSDLDEVARFDGRVEVEGARRCSGSAEVRLYESNLAVLPDAAVGFQWRLAEIDAVEFDERDYRVVFSRGAERLAVGRLAKRTGELAERVQQGISRLEERSARVLHALFPFLDAGQFQAVAGAMREGRSTPIPALRSVHSLIEPALLEKVVDGQLRPYVQALAQASTSDPWHAGFKIVRRDPDAGVAEDDEEQAAGAGEADLPGEDAVSEAPAGEHPSPAVIDLGDGLEVVYWFFFPLAPAAAREARVAWEATSRGGRATYVFRLPLSSEVPSFGEAAQALNRGLVALNFRREPVYLPDERLQTDLRFRQYAIAARKVPELALVRRAFVGRAIHRSVPAWRTQLERLAASSSRG